MKELTITFDDIWINKELKEYLLLQNGFNNVEIDDEYGTINIKYNPEIITIKIIKLEILAFMDILKTPSIISFNKNSKNMLTKTNIIIKVKSANFIFFEDNETTNIIFNSFEHIYS